MNAPPPEYDIFLSYNRHDGEVVEQLAQVLRGRDLRVFKDDWYLKPGEFWPAALEKKLAASRGVAVAVGRSGLGSWQQREAIAAIERQQAESRAGRFFPVIPVLLEKVTLNQAGLGFLLQNTWVECWDPRAPDFIAGAIRGKAPAELYDARSPDPRLAVCPYRGLSVFREEDSDFYFGRNEAAKDLFRALAQHRIVAVVGASGSGKSSLVRAGLIPQLRRRRDNEVWQIAGMVPGRRPFMALAQVLLALREPRKILEWSKGDIDDEVERLAKRLARDGAEHLVHVVEQILDEERGTTQLLLFIDQWEELYTNCPVSGPGAQAFAENVRQFIDMLVEALRQGPFRVVLTLRADFWGEILNDERLAKVLPDSGIVHLRAMDRSTLETVIRRPAEITKLPLTDGVVADLLTDALGQPGNLPLLEFALQELWKASASGTPIRDAYRAMGGLGQALVTRAEAVYSELDEEAQQAVPGVFAALVQVEEGRTDLRRRARLAELSEAGQRVARKLASDRLVVTNRDWTRGEEVVEVAHEALLKHWPKFGDWIRERRGALFTVRQLQTDAQHWIAMQKDSGYLWSHERVREAVVSLGRLGKEVVLSVQELEFLGPIDPQEMLPEVRNSTTHHQRRALLGERLAVLGDPRSGVGVAKDGTPDIAWCARPGGDVAIEVERRLRGGTKPRWRRVAPFQIARYPVTVAQYRAFLEAEDGWCDGRWWGGNLYREPEGNTYPFGRYRNHPAVYINWFDATAFCRWLSERFGVAIRLPNDWEWQQAATGGHLDNAYPWGPEWDWKREPHRANTSESRLGRPTAVGMYPDGAPRATPADDSPEKLGSSDNEVTAPLDMVGNVWEWCANKHEKPYVIAFHGDDFDPRVLRGGSFAYSRVYARCASRLSSRPYYRYPFAGFRILCSSQIRLTLPR